MRTPVKKRLHYFLTAISCYLLAHYLLPEQVDLAGDWLELLPVITASFSFFFLLPVLYWLWVIKAGEQKPWKMLIGLSLSFLVARYTFPEDVAAYFEFITYLRYPIIAIVLIIECYLIFTIVKGLWQARRLKGDPRIHTYEKYKNDDKKLTASMPVASEPATWFYVIPKFTRDHPKAMANLVLRSAKPMHFAFMLLACLASGSGFYWLLVDWSELAALFVASMCFYTVFFVTANYRIARHFSCYVIDNKLVINNSFLNLMVIDLDAIDSIQVGEFVRADNKEQICLGRGEVANVEISFSATQQYLGMLGQFNESVDKVWLCLDNPVALSSLRENSDIARTELAEAS
ncbi:hypothetical protein ACFSJY_15165 [Thalassotalea euphylliae]|uniref:hypothetical protein n=1 Tax=Thalassotalea euphylliae TaxID=1655234 RepID=UPI0036423C8F